MKLLNTRQQVVPEGEQYTGRVRICVCCDRCGITVYLVAYNMHRKPVQLNSDMLNSIKGILSTLIAS